MVVVIVVPPIVVGALGVRVGGINGLELYLLQPDPVPIAADGEDAVGKQDDGPDIDLGQDTIGQMGQMDDVRSREVSIVVEVADHQDGIVRGLAVPKIEIDPEGRQDHRGLFVRDGTGLQVEIRCLHGPGTMVVRGIVVIMMAIVVVRMVEIAQGRILKR